MKITPEDISDDDVRKWFKSNRMKVRVPAGNEFIHNQVSGEVIDKFKTIREYDIDYDLPLDKWDQDLPVIVVYCIWSQPLYFKCLYLSILSQINFTDIHRTKLVIFVAQNLYKEACSIFGGTNILIFPFYEKFFKHIVFSHEIFQNFNGKIVLFDCDTFVYSHGGKHDFYEQVSKLPSDGLYMMEDPDSALKVFYARKDLIPQRVSDEEYAKIWFDIIGKDIETIIPDDHWNLACVSVFNASFFKTNEWSEHVQKCWDLRTGCDETVFLTHAWSNNIPVSRVDDIPGINVRRIDKCIDFINDTSNKDLGILHPLHGSFCHDMRMQKIYDNIIDSSVEKNSIKLLELCDEIKMQNFGVIRDVLSIHHLDIVTSAFYYPDLPFSQEMIDLYLYHVEKNMDMPFTVHLFSTNEPKINYCIDNFIWHKCEDSEWCYEATKGWESILGVSNNAVLCTHIDCYFTGGVKEIVSKLNDEDYFYMGECQDQEWRRSLPRDNVYIPQICFAWGLFNPIKWRHCNCRILDRDMFEHSIFLERFLRGAVYQWDKMACILLTMYIHLTGEKVHFFSRPMKHINAVGSLPRVIYGRLIKKDMPDCAITMWARFGKIGELSTLYKSTFNKKLSLDIVKDIFKDI